MSCPLPFCIQDGVKSTDRITYSATPNMIFKGEALLLWGTDSSTKIHSLRAAQTEHLVIAACSVPALMYYYSLDYTDTLLKIERGEFLPSIIQQIDMRVIEPGQSVVLELSGPVQHAVVVGKGLV